MVVYRPPSNSPEDNVNSVNILQQLCFSKATIILGDFNMPPIDWSRKNAMFLNYDPLTTAFMNCFNSVSLTQQVNFPTFIPSGNILDLVLSTEGDRRGHVWSSSLLPILFNYQVITAVASAKEPGVEADIKLWMQLSSFDRDFEF